MRRAEASKALSVRTSSAWSLPKSKSQIQHVMLHSTELVGADRRLGRRDVRRRISDARSSGEWFSTNDSQANVARISGGYKRKRQAAGKRWRGSAMLRKHRARTGEPVA